MIRHLWVIVGICLFVFNSASMAIPWPLPPTDSSGHLGNSYGEYQYYGGFSYMHPGIDILAPAGTPVYAVKGGYVKAVLTTSAELHWRVAVGDSAGAAECDGWLYAHLDQASIIVNEGDWVDSGQYLGNLVTWPIANFHHLHFVKIRNSGVVWDSDWEFIANPLDELEVIDDPDAPVFENALTNQKFAFSPNGTTDYFTVGADLSGNVDIICKAWDYINHYSWKLAPYQLEYKIEGDSSIPWKNSVCFTGFLDWDNNVNVVYREDNVCHSYGDYNNRDYFFCLTNTDGDSVIESSDEAFSWETPNFHNGQYKIFVRAGDRAGNQTIDSMTVTIANYFAIDGAVSFSDGNPDLSGTIVKTIDSGDSVATDNSGAYQLAQVGGGSQLIRYTRPGYRVVDTTVMMNQNHTLQIEMTPTEFVLGDANYDGIVNVGDAVYIINHVFKGGAAPVPYAAGDANSDGTINVGDAVFLINYIFKGGPPPGGKY